MNVLIIRQEDADPGGISNYFKILKNKFKIENTHLFVGKRVNESKKVQMITRLLKDYIKCIKIIKNNNIDIVHINISLNTKGILRDSIFIIISEIFKKKILIFFHGWDTKVAIKIKKIYLQLFKMVFDKSNAFIVLAVEFKNKLIEWGFKQKIYVESTLIDDDLLNEFNINSSINNRLNDKRVRILYLSRVIREKGIYETIDAFAKLRKKHESLDLIVAGVGEELGNVKEYVKKNNISNIIFIGYVTGDKKINIFMDSYIFCLPSYYQEGMPISIIEAMAFGLPVITTKVGGIKDFFENERNGYAIEGRNIAMLAEYIEKIILNKTLYRKISEDNYFFAQERFLASKGVKRLENIYEQIMLK